MQVSSNQTMMALALKVHKVTGITVEDLKGKSRKVEICDARKLWCHFMLEYIKVRASLVTIGRWINKDHATVLHNNKVAKNLIETDRFFASKYRALYDECFDMITTPEAPFFNNIPQL
jgi:chromosomal replication initiation ATPase DnaA